MIAFAVKRNMARGASNGVFAAYLESTDGPYLGDVGPVYWTGSSPLPKAPHGGRRPPARGWWAHPAGERERLDLIFMSRDAAGLALLRRL